MQIFNSFSAFITACNHSQWGDFQHVSMTPHESQSLYPRTSDNEASNDSDSIELSSTYSYTVSSRLPFPHPHGQELEN